MHGQVLRLERTVGLPSLTPVRTYILERRRCTDVGTRPTLHCRLHVLDARVGFFWNSLQRIAGVAQVNGKLAPLQQREGRNTGNGMFLDRDASG